MQTLSTAVSPTDQPVLVAAHSVLPPSLAVRRAKRAFDIVGALLCLLLFSPVFLVIILLQWLTSGKNVFFRQERIGKDGRPFLILKFRTMCQDAEENGPQLTQIKDTTRCTPIGGKGEHQCIFDAVCVVDRRTVQVEMAIGEAGIANERAKLQIVFTVAGLAVKYPVSGLAIFASTLFLS